MRASVDIQNQVVLLSGGVLLYFECIVQQTGSREVLFCIALQAFDAQIRVFDRLDAMTYTGDDHPLPCHIVDELIGSQSLVSTALEIVRGTINGTTETRADDLLAQCLCAEISVN